MVNHLYFANNFYQFSILSLILIFSIGISKLFWRQAAGAIVVTDIKNENTLEDALDWKLQVDEHVWSKNGLGIPMVLAVNKYDLVKDYEDSGNELETYMQQDYLGNLNYFALISSF